MSFRKIFVNFFLAHAFGAHARRAARQIILVHCCAKESAHKSRPMESAAESTVGDESTRRSDASQTSAIAPTNKNTSEKSFGERAKAFWCKFWRYFRWVLLVLVIFALLAGVSLYNERRSQRLSTYHLDRIRSLLQYASKSADEAERVADDDAVQALLHADYAVTYFSAAQHIVDKQTIQSLIGTNLDELEQYLKSLQLRLIAKVYAQCA